MTDAAESDQDAATAAMLPFMQSFDLPEKEMAKRLYPAFVNAFRSAYKPPNRMYVRTVQWGSIHLAKWAYDLADGAFYLIQGITPTMPPLSQATYYGSAFGHALYAIEFIVNKNYDPQIGGEELYARFKDIATILHARGKHIRTDFIKKRIDKIGQEKAELLRADTKVLLAKIAALFA